MPFRCIKSVYVLGDGRNRVHFDDGGTMNQARLLGAIKIGRALEKNEVAHHRNGDCSDDRLENIEVLTNSQHSRWHGLNPKPPVVPKSRRYDTLKIRIPESVYAQLRIASADNHRSLNGEMVYRLQRSFEGWKQT